MRWFEIISESFDTWFNGSKVVDEQGRPLICYHGTWHDSFESFDTLNGNDFGAHFGNKEQANVFAQVADAPNHIVPVFLKITNPLRLPDLERWNWDSMAPVLQKLGIDVGEKPEYKVECADIGENYRRLHVRQYKALISAMENAGYDGIVYQNTHEGNGDSWIIFHPNQAKSAIGNLTFDQSKNEIAEQKRNSSKF